MTITRAQATVQPTVDDFFFELALAIEFGSKATRKTGTVATCPECKESVELIQDKVDRLTSYGATGIWRTRRPYTHSRACYEANHARPIPDINLWDC